MAPLIPNDRGFTADLRVMRIPCEPRNRHGRVVALAVFVISLVLGAIVLPTSEDGASTETNNSQQSVAPVDYQWRVYVLNQTGRFEADNGTTFSYRTEDLPQEFSTILFGDFRADLDGQGTYYGGCGILLEASGSSATFVLREIDGKFICSVPYTGQDPFVFSGERRSVSYPSVTTSYYGTDQIAQDWRNGTWSPDQGILVEHPDEVSLDRSEFYLMLFEPGGGLDIPEFRDLSLVLAFTLGAVAIVSRRNRREPR